MFTPKTRILICIGCLFLIGYSLYQQKIYATIVAFIFILFTIIGYFRQGTVYLSYRQLKAGKIKEAEQNLGLTKNVNWLSKIQKSYYYFVLGFIKLAQNQLDESKVAYQEALKIGMRLQNDQAMVLANLATINHKQKNKVKAREYIASAKKLKVKAITIKELERIEKMID
jgi:tetratricopeptide (TPR) repeat protein